jgi:hypothetical protein
MSREDPFDVYPVALGDCDCPGHPHEPQRLLVVRVLPGRTLGWEEVETEDLAHVKSRLDYRDLRRVAAAQGEGEGLEQAVLLLRGLVDWNLTTEEKGKTVPLRITLETLDGLNPRQAMALVSVLDRGGYVGGDSLPQAPGGPSADGPATSSSLPKRTTSAPARRSSSVPSAGPTSS